MPRYIIATRHPKVGWLMRALLMQPELVIEIPEAEARPFIAQELLRPAPSDAEPPK
jgi:hypothetical protein